MSKTPHTLLLAFLAILALLSGTAANPVANTANADVVIHRRASTASPCGNSTHCNLFSSSSKSSEGKSLGAYKLIAPGAKARPHPKRDDEELLQRRLIGLITTQIRKTTIMSTKTITSRATSLKTIKTTIPKITRKVTTISGTRRTLTLTTASPTVRITPVITIRTTVMTVPVVKTNVVTITRPFSSTVSKTTTTLKPSTTRTTPTATSTAGAQKAAELAILNAHNKYRARHGAPALTWDSNLAAFAANWANKCIWAHSGGPYGENGASSVGMDMTMADSVGMWYGEILDYNFLKPDFSYATGHFTQLVWKDSTTVGCAIAACKPSQLGYNWPYPGSAYNVWCEYSKNPGNVIGDFAQNVLKPNNLPVINGFVPSL
ncbi:hypothetical protein CF327_g4027 [Tilletia walkeri]|nr:hypothetical protein CF327_g4027 [Tilletia walkeri]